jgi:hypothetical protein
MYRSQSNTDPTKSATALSKIHACLCIFIAYREPAEQRNYTDEETQSITIQDFWCLDEIRSCFKKETSISLLNKANNRDVFRQSNVPAHIDKIFLSVALMQVGAIHIISLNTVMHGLYIKFLNETWSVDTVPRIDIPEVENGSFFGSNLKGKGETWWYILEVMMKMHLVYGANMSKSQTLDDDIKIVYERCLRVICTYAEKGLRVENRPYVTDALERGEIPIYPEIMGNRNMSLEVCTNAKTWFCNFVLYRVFGRQVSLAIASPATFFDNHLIETEFFKKSVLSNGEFDSNTFTELCWTNMKETDTVVTRDHPDLAYKKVKHILSNDQKLLHHKVLALHLFEVYKSYNIQMSFVDVRHDIHKFHIKRTSPKYGKDFRDVMTYLITIFCEVLKKRDTGRGMDHQQHSPTKSTPRVAGRRRRALIQFNPDEARSLRVYMETMTEDFKSLVVLYDKYKQRFESNNRDGVKHIEKRIHKYVKIYLGVNMGEHTKSIPPNAVAILSRLENPVHYQDALGLLVTMMSRDYANLVNIGEFATPENGLDTMRDVWQDWPCRFRFFLHLLLISLQSCTQRPGIPVTYGTPWLHQTHDASYRELSKNDYVDAFSDSECRRFLYPYHCLESFAVIFPGTRVENMRDAGQYTIAGLLQCIQTSGFRGMKRLQNETYQWKRHGFSDIYNNKSIVEHTLCIILILAGVDKIRTGIIYNGVSPVIYNQNKAQE